MNKSSLLKAKRIINDGLSKEKFDEDILEIIINLNHFLNPSEYEENVRILNEKQIEKKLGKY
jgi:hypothetical protein